MKELFDLLNEWEKKIIIALCLLLAVALLFFLLVSLPQKKGYFKALSSLRSVEKKYEFVNQRNMSRKEEWLRWEQARKDLEELRRKYFYDEKEGFPRLRLDLEQVFAQAGVHVSSIEYVYSDFKKEKTRKVNISFILRGSYLSLKKFIHSVEKLPRFLFVEKIDFLNIDPAREALELKIILAGYYGM